MRSLENPARLPADARTSERTPDEVALLRSGLYRLFGRVFSYPTGSDWNELRGGTRALARALASLSDFAFLPRLAPLFDELDRADPAQVGIEYLATFTARPQEPPHRVPRESVQRGFGPEETGEWLAVLEREYAQRGLELAVGSFQPADHASVQFEFLALLSAREAEAWGAGNEPEALELLRAESQFLTRYLGGWFPAFARRMTGAPLPAPFGRAVEAAEAFLLHEIDWIEALLHEGTDGQLPNGPGSPV